MSRARVVAPQAALLVLGLVACSRKGTDEARPEAGLVAHAVEQLRKAGNVEKRPFLKALEATACTASDVCSLKKTCTEAYTLEVTALEALAAVRSQVRGGAEIAASAVELLGQAEHDLEAAHDKTKTCADLEAEVRRTYSL